MQRASQTLTWLLPFGLLVLAIVTVPLRILDAQGLPRYRVLKDELRQIEGENDRVRRELLALSRQVESLRTDPASLERIARDELGMVREGELIFQFPD